MNIYDALKHVPWKKAEYFKWKHNIRYDQSLPKKTEQEFLRLVGLKSLNSFLAWEKSSQYKRLLSIYLNGLIANDLDEIYKKVAEKAKTGDPNSVKLFLQLQKNIGDFAKIAEKALIKDEEEEMEQDDGLEL